MPNRLLALLVVAISVQLAGTSAAEAVRRRAFVTSVSGTGDLGSWPDAGDAVGVEAGDAICRARAAAGSLPNASNYRAWLSTGATDAACHVRGLTGKKNACAGGAGVAAGPWYPVYNDTPWSGSVAALTDAGEIYHPLLVDEFGFLLEESTRVWTGTTPGGGSYIFGNYTCSGWDTADPAEEGLGGLAAATAGWWTDRGRRDCDVPHHLLCLEPGASQSPADPWAPASLVFVTSVKGTADLGSWPEAGGEVGLAAGDAICRNLAHAARLPAPDSFVAWLSTPAESAKDRLTSNGPFRRVDGHLIAEGKADLLDGALRTSIHVDENGDYYREGQPVRTATTDGGLSAFECGFLDTTEGVGYSGNLALSRSGGWTALQNIGCSVPAPVYCFSNVTTLFWDGFESGGDTSRWSAAVTAP